MKRAISSAVGAAGRAMFSRLAPGSTLRRQAGRGRCRSRRRRRDSVLAPWPCRPTHPRCGRANTGRARGSRGRRPDSPSVWKWPSASLAHRGGAGQPARQEGGVLGGIDGEGARFAHELVGHFGFAQPERGIGVGAPLLPPAVGLGCARRPARPAGSSRPPPPCSAGAAPAPSARRGPNRAAVVRGQLGDQLSASSWRAGTRRGGPPPPSFRPPTAAAIMRRMMAARSLRSSVQRLSLSRRRSSRRLWSASLKSGPMRLRKAGSWLAGMSYSVQALTASALARRCPCRRG